MTSTVNNSRIAKNTGYMYIRMAITMAISLYTSRIILDKLGVEDFGLYNVIGGVVVMLSFISGALSVTTQRFLSYELGAKNFKRLQLVFSQSLYVHIFLGTIAVVLLETIGLWFLHCKMNINPEKLDAAFWVYQFSIISFLITFIQVPYRALITAHERMNVFAAISILEALLSLLSAVLIGYIPEDRLIWFALIRLCASVIITICYSFYSVHQFSESRILLIIDWKILKEITSFAGWSVFGALAWTGKNQGINVILNLFFTTAVNAAYGVANQVNVAIGSFMQNFMVAVNPQIVKSYASGEFNHVNSLLIFGGKISFLLLFIIAFPISIAIEGILNFWLVDVPNYSIPFIRLILIVSLLESFTYAMGTALQATGKIKGYQILVGCTILLNLPLSWIILKLGYPPYAVFIIAIFISILTLIERMCILKKQIPGFSVRSYSLNVYLPSLLVVACSVGAYLILNYNSGALNNIHWLLQLLYAIIIAFIFAFSLGITKQEKSKIINIIYSKVLSKWKK